MTRFCFSVFFILLPSLIFAQKIIIKDFIIKENLSQNGKIAIIAVDSTDKADAHIRGSFNFSINGFQQTLQFEDGVAVIKDPIESSTFAFLKHKNQENEIGKFYYIRKSDTGINPIKISGLLLILIPILVLLIGYIFKRLLIVFVALAIAYMYLHFSKGLDISQILESFFLSIKNLI